MIWAGLPIQQVIAEVAWTNADMRKGKFGVLRSVQGELQKPKALFRSGRLVILRVHVRKVAWPKVTLGKFFRQEYSHRTCRVRGLALYIARCQLPYPEPACFFINACKSQLNSALLSRRKTPVRPSSLRCTEGKCVCDTFSLSRIWLCPCCAAGLPDHLWL